MPNNAPSSTLPNAIRSDRHSTAFVDVSCLARQYAITASVQLDRRTIQGYDGYPSSPIMDTAECVVSVLCYLVACEPDCETLSVILTRAADGRPVEVILHLRRLREGERDLINLVFAEEIEL
jgi:hypothetical protein